MQENFNQMNKVKQEIERRKILNQLRHTSLREGNFRAYASEGENHIRRKFELWLKLKKAGYQIWTEAITKKGKRIDILAFIEGRWVAYEIVESESEKSLIEKSNSYPVPVIPVRSFKQINELDI